MTDFTTKDLKGKKVVGRNGHEVGTIDDVVIQPDGWSVDSFVIEVKDEIAQQLDLKKKLFGKAHLRVSPTRVSALGDYLTLNVDVGDMKETLTGEASPTD